MPLDALALALSAALLHALWNLFLARERDTEAAAAVAVSFIVLSMALPAALTWRVEAAAVPYIVVSGTLELVYVVLLVAAYRRFELSVVYPVARGLAPVLVLVLTVIVAVSRPSAGEVAGVLAVAAGVFMVRGHLRGSLGGLGVGALIAAVIAGYTVADRYGIHHANAAPYLMLVMLGPAIAYPLFVGRTRYARAFDPATVAIGVAAACAYLLVLLALRLASAPAVAAVRETSVVIATALAAVVLKERVGPLRLAGAVLVAAGVALLALS
ncbi:MAG TPA: EamA family transporter [Gaiellaceae bacterium]|nr:EamA family transporter [Gaiellaceae bacterium]